MVHKTRVSEELPGCRGQFRMYNPESTHLRVWLHYTGYASIQAIWVSKTSKQHKVRVILAGGVYSPPNSPKLGYQKL